jgi:hypothetical protein
VRDSSGYPFWAISLHLLNEEPEPKKIVADSPARRRGGHAFLNHLSQAVIFLSKLNQSI